MIVWCSVSDNLSLRGGECWTKFPTHCRTELQFPESCSHSRTRQVYIMITKTDPAHRYQHRAETLLEMWSLTGKFEGKIWLIERNSLGFSVLLWRLQRVTSDICTILNCENTMIIPILLTNLLILVTARLQGRNPVSDQTKDFKFIFLHFWLEESKNRKITQSLETSPYPNLHS